MKFAIGIAACAVAYFCAYFLLSNPNMFCFCSLGCAGTPFERVVEFRTGGEIAKRIFAPLTWADQSIRPRYWSGVKLFDGTTVRGDDPRASGIAAGGGFSGAPPSTSTPEFPDPDVK